MELRMFFDALVIGAGINGLCTARALAQRGVKRLAVVERRGHIGKVLREGFRGEPGGGDIAEFLSSHTCFLRCACGGGAGLARLVDELVRSA